MGMKRMPGRIHRFVVVTAIAAMGMVTVVWAWSYRGSEAEGALVLGWSSRTGALRWMDKMYGPSPSAIRIFGLVVAEVPDDVRDGRISTNVHRPLWGHRLVRIPYWMIEGFLAGIVATRRRAARGTKIGLTH
jgi:hypothetical protein